MKIPYQLKKKFKPAMSDLSQVNLTRIRKYIRRGSLELLSVAEAVWNTFRDDRTPLRAKTALGAAILYLLSPLDMIPDLLPGGFLDDLAVLGAAILTAGTLGKEHLQMARRRHGLSDKGIKDVTPTKD